MVVGDLGECWQWRGAHNAGRPITSVGSRTDGTRRTALVSRLLMGEPSGSFVCHTCDNPGCVNPGHLYIGSAKTNAEDRVARKRDGATRGTSHWKARLTDTAVDRMRALYRQGTTYAELAKRFGVSEVTVWRVVRRHSWRQV